MNMLSDKDAALHMLKQLREEVGAFPSRLTPKYPLPTIMQTERQIRTMQQFANNAGCDDVCLGLEEGEIDMLISKSQILRGRFLLRKWRKGEVAAGIEQLVSLINSGLDIKEVGIRPDELENFTGLQSLGISASHIN